jgi:hypothetical protein
MVRENYEENFSERFNEENNPNKKGVGYDFFKNRYRDLETGKFISEIEATLRAEEIK